MSDLKNSLGITILKPKPINEKAKCAEPPKINTNTFGDTGLEQLETKTGKVRRATIYFSIDTELHKALIKFAEAEKRTKTNAIYAIIRRYLMPHTINQATKELTEELGLLDNGIYYGR